MKRHRPPPPHFIREHTHYAWRDLALISLPVAFFCALVVALVVWLVNPSPPRTITISAGPRDSAFMAMAEAYRTILARNGIKLKVIESDGSVQNLARLLDPKQHVDVGFVQGGVVNGRDVSSLMSLGSVEYLPMVVFYRGSGLTQLSQLEGKRIAIGREGSGTRLLSLNLLDANGIDPGGDTTLLPLDGLQAATQLVSGNADAAMLSGDSATRGLMLRLLTIPGISVMSFDEAAAYTRLFPYLEHIELPPGVLDLSRRVPPETINLVGPTVEIVARDTLHPAISDLLVEAATEVNGPPGLLQHAGEFPNTEQHDFRISEDATRYYKSGKSFLYRTLPFWLASVADRLLVLLLPLAVLVIPALRMIPALYSWRVRSRIYRYYGALIAIERDALKHTSEDERRQLLDDLDAIERSLNTLHMPLAYADAFYVLREHIGFVRVHLNANEPMTQ
jgi:hypothetical protein